MPIEYALFFLAGYSVIFGLAIAGCWAFRNRLKRRRPPIQENLLRLPGEALQRESEKIETRFMGSIVLAAMIPLITFGTLAFGGPTVPLWLLFPAIAIALVGIYISVTKLWGFLEYRADIHLGLLGERAVGEQLLELLPFGYQIFHDFPGETGPHRWSIDHVAVGPAGVFAIETKTRRKGSVVLPRRTEHEIVFDGAKLQFPWGEDTFGLEQAERSAASLSSWLSGSVGEGIAVRPVLVFPGWHVTRQGKSPVLVLNHKELKLALPSEGLQRLSDQTIQRIVFQLEQRCRDVKF